MYKIEMVVGDWSNDGHGMTDKYHIEANASHLELAKAYEVGTKIIGFNFTDEVCSDYEDNVIKSEHREILVQHGFKGELADYLEEHSGYFDENKDFVEVYMFIVELGFKSLYGTALEWSFINANIPQLKVGGYGLFFN
jgi:hypothetical protein